MMGGIMAWTWDTSLGVDRCNEEIAQCFGNGDPVALKLDATMSLSQSQAGHGLSPLRATWEREAKTERGPRSATLANDP